MWEQASVTILSCSKENYLLTLLEIVRFFAWSHCSWYTWHEIALKLRSCLYMCMSITRKGEVLLQEDLTGSQGIRIGCRMRHSSIFRFDSVLQTFSSKNAGWSYSLVKQEWTFASKTSLSKRCTTLLPEDESSLNIYVLASLSNHDDDKDKNVTTFSI